MDDNTNGSPTEGLLIEDYKLWLRELEKQDRWLGQQVWIVLAGAAAGLPFLMSLHGSDRLAVGLFGAFVALTFISLNADFLSSRVLSYRQVSRRVAKVRQEARLSDILRLTSEDIFAGSPLLSVVPGAFTRTAYARRGTGFRHLLLVHELAIATIYLMLYVTLRGLDGPAGAERWRNALARPASPLRVPRGFRLAHF
jgi:hypothetical protein